ncbi:MAG: two-component regulator propeller domain-containing protein [Gemmatimonadota bacterium]
MFGRRTAAAVLGLSIALLSTAPLHAQQERISFRHLTIADGLSQNAVRSIVQDDRGFMWLGTKDGLNRYDGYTFTVFRHDPLDSTSVSDSEITALLEDRRGRLWVGTQTGGLNRFDRDRETFHRYPDGPTDPITSIEEDLDGTIWIGTDGAGLYRLFRQGLEGTRSRFHRYTHAPKDPRSLSHDVVYDVLVDRSGTLWVGTEAGLNRYDKNAAKAGFARYTVNPASPVGLIDSRISALYEDSKGRLWIGSVPGLSVFDSRRQHLTHYYHRYRTYRYGWGEAIALLEGRDGRIWMSTASELMRFDPTTQTFEYFQHDPRDLHGINSNRPTALFHDRTGVLWIGTNGFGINVHDQKTDRFQTFRRPEDHRSRQDGFSVYTLFEDQAGSIWIDAGLLYRWDRKTGAFTSFETTSDRPDDFGNTGVWSIVEDPPGVLWAGSYQGLYRYEVAPGSYRQYKHRPGDQGGLPEPIVFDVVKDREGSIWVVTENYLCKLVDPERGLFRSLRYNERPTSGQWTFPSTVQDSSRVFWLGSNQGLVRFDLATETFRHYRNDPQNPTSLSHNAVRSILLDPREPERYLWIGTAGGGLNRFDFESQTFARFTEKDGLPNNVVYGILADDDGLLWMSTNKGLSRFDPRTGRFRNYDVNDGLQSNEFNSGAYFKSPSGELLFGGLYGFNHFYPEDIRDNTYVPPIVITGFKRANRYETIADSAAVLRKAISESDSLRLSYRDDVITFEFAALDYSAPAKNRYAYRLVGFNDEWIESGSVRSATFTNLPPGSYTFQVKGSNNDGIWNEDGTSLAILITPPWWRTWWAYALYVGLALTSLYAVRRYEMGRMRLKNRLALRQLETDQLRELDRAKSRFFANVSHEFRTPLTLTLGPLDDLRAGLYGELPQPMAEQVDLARRNAARVLDLINQILDVARLEAGRTPLRARQLDLGALVESVGQAFVPLAERKALTLGVESPAKPLMLYGDPEHLDKALSNLLSNALKFTPPGGAVRVHVEADTAAARIAIRDNGPGIPAGELSRIFERFHRVDAPSTRDQPGTGIGLALAKELAELHGGSLIVESEVGFGSTFTITLPRGRLHLTPDQLVENEAAAAWAPRVAPLAEQAALDNGAGPVLEREIEPAEEDVTTVLVVEDNPDVRAYVKRHLAPRYRVLEAIDGEEGLEMTRRRLPDLVLSDVMMPGLDGYELCRALKEDPETDFIPLILLTARAAVEDRLAGLQEHADDYLVKPFDMRELLARVENLIESRKRLRARFTGTAVELHPSRVDIEAADERFLDRVRAAIEENMGDETFSVERLAREVAQSRGNLHRRLRALLDESPSELIRRMRLERAAQLIETGAGSISEIAYSVGFKSVAHFSNRFVEHFGVRPSTYRASRTT